MRPTLRSVLAMPALREARIEVLSGADRLDTSVRWVHVGEVPDLAGLLSGGELVLTTGLAMAGAPEQAAAYVRSLVDAGAAGLAVELGDRFAVVPDAALAEARRASFPVVALHRRVRFVEVTEQVHRVIVADQLDQVEFAREVHERFTALSLAAADPSAIVAAAAELVGSSVVLEDLGRHVLAYEARGRPAAGLLADWERRSRAAAPADGTSVTGPEGWVTTPVGLPGRRWGRLVVPDPQADQARLGMVLERAAQALELGRMVERDRLGMERQAHGGLLADLLAGRADEELAAARASALGLPEAPEYVGVVVADPSPRDLADTLARALTTAGLPALVGQLGGEHVGALLAVRPRRRGAAPDPDAALDALAARLPDGVLLGVGPAAASIVVAGAGLGQAAHVADVAQMLPRRRDRRWVRASDVRLHGLVAQLAGDPRLQAFVEAELGPLLAHEARHGPGSGLLETLRHYVAAGGNTTKVAAATHRSRAAVYKRLDRLERVLGVDLDDPLSVMSIGVALLAYDQSHPPA